MKKGRKTFKSAHYPKSLQVAIDEWCRENCHRHSYFFGDEAEGHYVTFKMLNSSIFFKLRWNDEIGDAWETERKSRRPRITTRGNPTWPGVHAWFGATGNATAILGALSGQIPSAPLTRQELEDALYDPAEDKNKK